jgi:virginiamycin B lyase
LSPFRKASRLRSLIPLILAALVLPLAAPAPPAQLAAPSAGVTFNWATGYVLVQHPLPLPDSQPWAITTDERGDVWFVEQGTNLLGEYSPATGSFTQYPIPTGNSTPDAITADRSGNIWFTELTADNLGELPAGGSSIVEYPIPPVSVNVGGLTQRVPCGPGSVISDPAGDVWVACLFSNQIDEFSAARHAFDAYDLPVFQSGPAGMVLDGKGDLWFTAADSNMLGEAVISGLVNGTSQGISEFAPLNQTYVYRSEHLTSFLGNTTVIRSSLPTPSGIALAPGGTLWVTEHVDSSFDSYNVATRSLTKYWTTQTFDAYGYQVTFPNGVAVDPSGDVWIGEHYGNRVAEFTPSSGTMTEYPVPCCATAIAGVYSVALAPDGRLWFVEIGGDAIGEAVPAHDPLSLSLSVPASSYSLGTDGAVTIPLTFALGSPGNRTDLALSLSGISATGAVQNMTARFSNPEVSLSPGGEARANLTLSLHGLNPGVYYLTLGATAPSGVIYSAILKLSVGPGTPSPTEWVLIPAAAATVVAAGGAGWMVARRSQGRRGRARSRLISITTTSTKAANPTPAAR